MLLIMYLKIIKKKLNIHVNWIILPFCFFFFYDDWSKKCLVQYKRAEKFRNDNNNLFIF